MLLILLLSLSIVSACQSRTNEGTVELTLNILGKEEVSKFRVKNSSLLQILESKHNITTKETLITNYVECIDNICANDEYSWTYTINEIPSHFPMKDYYPEDNDSIVISYGKVG